MPSSVQLRVLIDGEAQFSRRAHGLLRTVTNWRPFLEWFKAEYVDLLRRRMDAEGAVDGESKWQPLDEKYAAWKERHFPGKPILQRTGAMYQAITDPDVELSDTRLAITIDNDYAIYHHSNLPRGSNLARRVIADLTGPFKRRMMAAWREAMKAG